MDKSIEILEQAKKHVDQKYKEILVHVQTSCKHKKVFERDWFTHAEWLPAHRPIRICSNCGLTEEGWGCGYRYLFDHENRTVTRINKGEGRKYMRGKRILQSNNGKLLRGEVTLKEFLLS